MADGHVITGILKSASFDESIMAMRRTINLEVVVSNEQMARDDLNRPSHLGAFINDVDVSGHWGVRGPRAESESENNNEEYENMYEVIIIPDESSKSALIYVRLLSPKDPSLGTEVYLTKDGTEVGREPGAEMPLYEKVPNELFIPLATAARGYAR